MEKNRRSLRTRKILSYALTKRTKRFQASIEILNNDCLVHIFSFLPLHQVVHCEKVCQRWKDVCRDLWSRKKTLIFEWKKWEDDPHFAEHLAHVLRDSGPYLRTLDLHEIFRKTCNNLSVPAIISTIGGCCKRLQHLDISYFKVSENELAPLVATVAPNLVTLKMDGCNVFDHILAPILKEATKLEGLCLAFNDIDGSSLLELTDKMKYLDVNKCTSLQLDILRAVIKRLPNLRAFKADNTCVNSDVIKELPKQISELSLSSVRVCFSGDNNSSFPTLRKLNVSNNSRLNDQILAAICDACPHLEELDISECREIRKEGFQVLVTLTKLTVLRMDKCHVDCELLDYLTRSNKGFKRISCRCCDLDFLPANTIKACPSLLCIDVGDHYFDNYSLFLSQLYSIQRNRKGKPLIIHARSLWDEDNPAITIWKKVLKIEDNVCRCDGRYKASYYSN